MSKYKVVCTATFSDSYIKNYKPRKKIMQRTFYYIAKSKKHALQKLKMYQGIEKGKGSLGTWEWTNVSVEEVKDE